MLRKALRLVYITVGLASVLFVAGHAHSIPSALVIGFIGGVVLSIGEDVLFGD